ncbi:MAG: sulfatase [Solirubrobacterales bacterium]
MDRVIFKAKNEGGGAMIAIGLLVLLATILFSSVSPVAGSTPSSAGPSSGQPNVVVIQVDDQTARQFKNKFMPKTMRLLTRRGSRFSDYIATTPQCCPSRASLLTGQYAHNNGVTSNGRGYPGLRDKDNVLPVWLQQAGYNTIHVGKFLNGYWKFVDRPADVAPGWTDWRTVVGGRFGYYDYFISRNGQWHHYGKHKRDYITRVLTRSAVNAIDRYAPDAAPFYLQLDEHAPHGSGGRQVSRCSGKHIRAAKPDPQDINAFRGAPLPHPPSFNERQLADKPKFLRKSPRLDRDAKVNVRFHWRCALASLVAVDRSVATVRKSIKRMGELDNTVFIYVSDNGLFFGEHRLQKGKVLPYEEALRLPLFIDLPGEDEVPKVHAPAGNIDLAPTILDLADASPCPPTGECRVMDGRSLMPLVTNTGAWPGNRGLLTEYRAGKSGRYQTCHYDGIRTGTSIYVEHYSVVADPATRKCRETLQVERYDLERDPFELRNLCYGGAISRCPTDGQQDSLQQRLHDLSNCAGIEGRDERVHGRPFCE